MPFLSASARNKCVVWDQIFWMFWKRISALNPEKYVIVLCNMNIKWFYAIGTRSNQKIVSSKGVLPCDFDAQHKSHIGKEMYIVMTGYQLNNNDIIKGGKAFPVSLVRIGRQVKATKDSYRQVYTDNVTYHYSKIAANKLWAKGEYCFKSYTITGSSESTEKHHKFLLSPSTVRL